MPVRVPVRPSVHRWCQRDAKEISTSVWSLPLPSCGGLTYECEVSVDGVCGGPNVRAPSAEVLSTGRGVCVGGGAGCATEAQLQDERIKVLELERQVEGRSAVGSTNPDKVRAESHQLV